LAAISIAEFEAALDAHGPDLSRWPDMLRREAETLLATSEDARQALAAAQVVEAGLRASTPKAPASLADRIVDRALGKRRTD